LGVGLASTTVAAALLGTVGVSAGALPTALDAFGAAGIVFDAGSFGATGVAGAAGTRSSVVATDDGTAVDGTVVLPAVGAVIAGAAVWVGSAAPFASGLWLPTG
jgi:hypothetical protein